MIKRNRTRQQKGGALARHKPRLVDKIVEGASKFLSGPSPSFASLALKLAGQAAKGVKDNVNYHVQKGHGLLSSVGKVKTYKRRCAQGTRGHYKRHPRPRK